MHILCQTLFVLATVGRVMGLHNGAVILVRPLTGIVGLGRTM